MSTSVGSKTSSMPVIELTVVPPSLIESAAMCEWQSMMPGETNLPAPSTTSAPAGTATFAPTAAILPSRSTIVPFWIVPLVAVRIVAPLIATTRRARGLRLRARGDRREREASQQERRVNGDARSTS